MAASPASHFRKQTRHREFCTPRQLGQVQPHKLGKRLLCSLIKDPKEILRCSVSSCRLIFTASAAQGPLLEAMVMVSCRISNFFTLRPSHKTVATETASAQTSETVLLEAKRAKASSKTTFLKLERFFGLISASHGTR